MSERIVKQCDFSVCSAEHDIRRVQVPVRNPLGEEKPVDLCPECMQRALEWYISNSNYLTNDAFYQAYHAKASKVQHALEMDQLSSRSKYERSQRLLSETKRRYADEDESPRYGERQQLELPDNLFDMVQTQVKRAVIRKGMRRVCPGLLDLVSDQGSDARFTVNVTEVRYLPFSKLSNEDAKLYGLETAGQLMDALKEADPEFEEDGTITIVVFRRHQ